jgi:hypothetical protein
LATAAASRRLDADLLTRDEIERLIRAKSGTMAGGDIRYAVTADGVNIACPRGENDTAR